jgi:hypothetical protein
MSRVAVTAEGAERDSATVLLDDQVHAVPAEATDAARARRRPPKAVTHYLWVPRG